MHMKGNTNRSMHLPMLTIHVSLPLGCSWDPVASKSSVLRVVIHTLPTNDAWQDSAATLLSQHNHVLVDAINHALVELGMHVATECPNLTDLTVEMDHSQEILVDPYVQMCMDLVPVLRGLQCIGVNLRSLRSTLLYNTSRLSESGFFLRSGP